MLVEPGALIGSVELGELLSEGKASALYAGRHTRLDLNVAVRIARGVSEHDRERYFEEQRAVTQLRHPSIVRAIDFGAYDELRYLVSLRVRGQSLVAVLSERSEPFSEAELLQIVAGIGAALRQAHAVGVAHRDLRSSKLFLGSELEVRITDFGFAPAFLDPGFDESRESDGRLPYLPPECILEQAAIGPGADLYALGVIAYQLSFGCLPQPSLFDARGDTEAARLGPRLDLPTRYSSEWTSLIGRLLAYAPEERIRTAAALLAALPGESRDAARRASREPGALMRPAETSARRSLGALRPQLAEEGSKVEASPAPERREPEEFMQVAQFLQRRFGSSASRLAGESILHSSRLERFLVWALLLALGIASAAALMCF